MFILLNGTLKEVDMKKTFIKLPQEMKSTTILGQIIQWYFLNQQ